MLALTGCEQMISDVEAPPTASKLVVSGFISPDNEEIKVMVSMTNAIYVEHPVNEGQFTYRKDATVLISDGSDTVQLQYDPQSSGYTISQQLMPVVEGRTYYLKVTAPGDYEATSSCTVPDKLPPDLEIERIDTVGSPIDTVNNPFNQSYIYYFKFRDLPGEGDFYGIYAGMYGEYEFSQEPYYFYDAGFEHGEPFVSDKNKDGEYFTYKTYEVHFNDEASKFYLVICLGDENYYKYHKALYNREEENPFVEPYPVFSNMKGSLGVFSAFTRKTIEFH